MKIEVITQVLLKLNDQQEPVIGEVIVKLLLPSTIDKSMYFDDYQPNERGVDAITETLINGLVANIHGAHKSGIKNNADHLQYIVTKLATLSGAKVTVK